ncbi:hypothetical protein ACC771_11530, partial [Rhizobium ruizarguesonis]
MPQATVEGSRDVAAYPFSPLAGRRCRQADEGGPEIWILPAGWACPYRTIVNSSTGSAKPFSLC